LDSTNILRNGKESSTAMQNWIGRKKGAHPPKRPVPANSPPVPVGMAPEEEHIFQQLLASVDAGHFTGSDLPLLVAYCQAVAQHDRATARLRYDGDVVDGKCSPWLTVLEKAQRAMVALSMRLRLSPQARREKAQLPQPKTWWEKSARFPHSRAASGAACRRGTQSSRARA
jgi:phage terminase small subunit